MARETVRQCNEKRKRARRKKNELSDKRTSKLDVYTQSQRKRGASTSTAAPVSAGQMHATTRVKSALALLSIQCKAFWTNGNRLG